MQISHNLKYPTQQSDERVSASTVPTPNKFAVHHYTGSKETREMTFGCKRQQSGASDSPPGGAVSAPKKKTHHSPEYAPSMLMMAMGSGALNPPSPPSSPIAFLAATAPAVAPHFPPPSPPPSPPRSPSPTPTLDAANVLAKLFGPDRPIYCGQKIAVELPMLLVGDTPLQKRKVLLAAVTQICIFLQLEPLEKLEVRAAVWTVCPTQVDRFCGPRYVFMAALYKEGKNLKGLWSMVHNLLYAM